MEGLYIWLARLFGWAGESQAMDPIEQGTQYPAYLLDYIAMYKPYLFPVLFAIAVLIPFLFGLFYYIIEERIRNIYKVNPKAWFIHLFITVPVLGLLITWIALPDFFSIDNRVLEGPPYEYKPDHPCVFENPGAFQDVSYSQWLCGLFHACQEEPGSITHYCEKYSDQKEQDYHWKELIEVLQECLGKGESPIDPRVRFKEFYKTEPEMLSIVSTAHNAMCYDEIPGLDEERPNITWTLYNSFEEFWTKKVEKFSTQYLLSIIVSQYLYLLSSFAIFSLILKRWSATRSFVPF